MKASIVSRLLKIVAIILILIWVVFMIVRHPDKPLSELKNLYTNDASAWVNVNGMDLHYRVEGQGPPLVLIHGTAASLHTWDGWTQELQDRFTIYRMDLPAFGLTGAHPSADYTIPAYVDFLREYISAMALDSFALAGNSLGGHIAWSYAVDHPGQVTELILLDAAGYPQDQPTKALAFQVAQSSILSPLLKHITPKSFVKKNLVQVYGDDTKITDDIVTRYHDMTLRQGNRQAFIDRVHTNHQDHSADISKISCPTLILWGEEDTWVQLSDAERFQEDIAGSKLIIYPGVGHVPMEEAPTITAQDVADFLRK